MNMNKKKILKFFIYINIISYKFKFIINIYIKIIQY